MKRFLLFTALTVLIFSCKKENRIDKNLWTKGGVWNIISINEIYTTNSGTSNQTFSNAGTFQFNEDGSGFTTYTIDEDAEVLPFIYHVADGKLNMSMDGEHQSFDMTWKKDELELYMKLVEDSEVYEIKYNLSKKK